ncbi:MAG TPA: cytochrome d ubiquinol oxidase subunit II [Polyangiaceae bacterium]|jgi:cytochrome d ubiquinol oxidase subunit II|nr:cytochrome d ubiquinol oxidase subunit II [Polyangiaceae bacterium]
MAELWFALLGLMLVAYVVLDGFDFGAGMLHLFVAKTDAERRTVLSAIGPFWDGNEVWLIAVGGALFVAFPEVLTTAFPAFYLALHLVLWCFVLRGIAIEVRSHVKDAIWHSLWDAAFAVSSSLLALLFGVALGNVVRGVPLDESGEFTLALFTDFLPRGQVGLLDYYTLSVGLLALFLLAAHGAAFLAFRTLGPVRDRCLALERKLWPLVAALFLAVTLETHFVRPDLTAHLATRPTAWLGIAVAVGGAALLVSSRLGKLDGRAFIGSSALIAGLLGAAGAGLFPVLLHSTLDPKFDLDALHHQARNSIAMRFALGWWPFALALAVSYFVNAFRVNRGRATEQDY